MRHNAGDSLSLCYVNSHDANRPKSTQVKLTKRSNTLEFGFANDRC